MDLPPFLFSGRLHQDRCGDHKEADQNAEKADRFPLDDPEEKADQKEKLHAIKKLFLFLAGRIENTSLKHPMQAPEIEHSKEPADDKRGAEAPKEKNSQKPESSEDKKGEAFNPAERRIAAGAEEIGIDRRARRNGRSDRRGPVHLKFFENLVCRFDSIFNVGGAVSGREKEGLELRRGKIDPFFEEA